MSEPSMYAPIWDKLKKDKVVSIAANRRLHPRILKAVKKRKQRDVVYKLFLHPREARLSSSSNGTNLTFYLTIDLKQIGELDI